MTLSDRAAAAGPYVQQLLDNSDVQASAQQAARAAQAAYKRARGKDTAELAKDKKFRGQVSEATAALGRLWGASTEPPPKPRSRRPALLLVILILVGGAVALTNESARARIQELIGHNTHAESTPGPAPDPSESNV